MKALAPIILFCFSWFLTSNGAKLGLAFRGLRNWIIWAVKANNLIARKLRPRCFFSELNQLRGSERP